MCYPPYGCFSDEPPYDRLLVKLPESPQVVGTKFMLYTRAQSANPDIISDADPSSIRTSTFDGKKATFFVVHGYLGKFLLYQLLTNDIRKLLSIFSNGIVYFFAFIFR